MNTSQGILRSTFTSLIGWLFLVLGLLLSGFVYSQTEANLYNVGYGYYNVYLLAREDNILLIDSGLPNKIKKLERRIRKVGYQPAEVQWMVLTHYHADHVGAAAWFQQNYGTKIIMHRDELHIAQKGSFDSLKIVAPNKLLGIIAYSQVIWEFPPFTPDILVDSTYNLSQHGFEATIHTVRGHTKGSLIVSMKDKVFVGDLVRGGLFLNERKPRIHFFAKDFKKVSETIQRLAQEPYKQWYPGHGGVLEQEKIQKFFRKNIKHLNNTAHE
ncbi:MAG: MBL fold metallo-hydrolase [Thermonemataceae bacterium]